MNRPRLSAVIIVLVMTVLTGCGNSSVPAASPQATGTETAVVGTVVGRQLSAYTAPDAARPFLRLSATTPFGSPRVVLVRAVRGSWLQVLLPVRPNGSSGWVRRSELTLTKVRYRVRVSLAARQLVIYRGEQELFRTTAAVGASTTPTPKGLYFVTDVVRTSTQQAAYGPYALGLSGHSRCWNASGTATPRSPCTAPPGPTRSVRPSARAASGSATPRSPGWPKSCRSARRSRSTPSSRQ